jgi:hypothetical protein
MWPLAALLRVVVWAYGLFFAYWIVRHLVESPESRLRKQLAAFHSGGGNESQSVEDD